MNNTLLNEKVKAYAELKAQADALAQQMSDIKTEIINEMKDLDKFVADDGTIAKLVVKETFKYEDEPSMIKWLKNNGYAQFVVEKVNATSMNKELKKGLTLTESLKSMFTKTTFYSLTVER